MEYLDALQRNPLVWLFLSLIAVIGFILIFRPKKKLLLYHVEEMYNIDKPGDSQERISILFDGKEVPNVVVSTLIVWNGRSHTIRSSDIAPKDPLTYLVEGEILSAVKTGESKKTNNARVLEPQKNSVSFDFDYLEKNDGFSVQIVHTKNAQGFAGTVIGGAKKKVAAAGRAKGPRLWRIAIRYAELCFAAVFIFVFTMFCINQKNHEEFGTLAVLWIILTASILGAFVFPLSTKMLPNLMPPSDDTP